ETHRKAVSPPTMSAANVEGSGPGDDPLGPLRSMLSSLDGGRANTRSGMKSGWPDLRYDEWSETCDTLHAHTQVLGKLAARLAPPEPELQHAALHLTARGWETLAVPTPDRAGAVVVALDLHAHEAVVEHSDGSSRRVPLLPD